MKCHVCIDVETKTASQANQMKWTLGPYVSPANLEDHGIMLQRICVLPGHYVLTCFNAAKPEGWHNSYLRIQGQRYCDDFTAYKAFRNIEIHGM